MLLIITTRLDLASDFFIQLLQERDIPYFRFNVDEFPDAARVAFDTVGSSWIQNERRRVRLRDVTAVWYRRALAPPHGRAVPETDAPFAQRESRHFLEGTFLSLKVPWVNHPLATQLGERKLCVLRLAQESGLQVPSSIASNDPEALTNFADMHPDLVVKPVYSGLQTTPDGSCYSVYARPFDHRLLSEAQAIESCPTFLQARVDKVNDLRVTFFGDEYFAVSIDSNGALDWRVPDASLLYSTVSLDDATVTSCRKLMSTLGISYGAFDFATADDGTLYFFEVNPAGEWAWLEKELGLPMRRALVGLFGRLTGDEEWQS